MTTLLFLSLKTQGGLVHLLPTCYSSRPTPNTLGPLQTFSSTLYTSSSYISWGGGVGYILGNTGLLSNIYIGNSSTCTVTFRDPMDDVINAYREFAFQMTIEAAADSSSISDIVLYASQMTQVIYVVDFQNLAVAMVVGMLGAIAVLPFFRGWWALGREMSINPIELANAFRGGVEIFSAVNGNSTAEDIARWFRVRPGDGRPLKLKYGVLADIGRLALGYEEW